MAPTEITVEDARAETSTVPPLEDLSAGGDERMDVDAPATDQSVEIVMEPEPQIVVNPHSLSPPGAVDRSTSPPPRVRSLRSTAQPPSSPQASSSSLAPASLGLEPNTKIVRDEDGRIVLEILDTPKTRKEKSIRKKEEKAGGHAVGSSQAGPSAAHPATLVTGASHLRVSTLPNMGGDEGSELSALSDLDDAGEEKMEAEGSDEIKEAEEQVEREEDEERLERKETEEQAGREEAEEPVEANSEADANVEDGTKPDAEVASEIELKSGGRKRWERKGRGRWKRRKIEEDEIHANLTVGGIITLEKGQYLEGGTLGTFIVLIGFCQRS